MSPAASETPKAPAKTSDAPPKQAPPAASEAKRKRAPKAAKKKHPQKTAAPQSYRRLDTSISVLMAEKSPVHLPKLKELFADFQLSNITYTGDGYRAISYVKEKKFDLIFVGQTLSNVNGISAIESFRQVGENVETPIVFMWEGVEKTFLDKATSVGASAFLQKPAEEVHFRKIFEMLLNKYIVSYDDERERANEAMKPMVLAPSRGHLLHYCASSCT